MYREPEAKRISAISSGKGRKRYVRKRCVLRDEEDGEETNEGEDTSVNTGKKLYGKEECKSSDDVRRDEGTEGGAAEHRKIGQTAGKRLNVPRGNRRWRKRSKQIKEIMGIN
jgi:hypothetical protein